MGWLDSLWGRRSDDPLQDLDPKVREFLRKEVPVKYDGSKPEQDGQDQQAIEGGPGPATTSTNQKARGSPSSNTVPKESLYQDGRYAHLWKTYKPLGEIENETKSDHEKLQDVLDSFKGRKAAIGQAALENCSEEQLDWNNCMKSGSLRARMTMCSDEVRKFERCYNMQSRLLKALGYINALDRSPEMDERIQMHADKLYHQMLEQEAAIEKAKAEGLPEPKFEPFVPKVSDDRVANMSEEAKKRYQDALAKVDEKEREAEAAAIQAELRSKEAMVGKVKELWKEQELERQARKARGEETLKDKVAAVFGTRDSTSEKKN
ncbi:hypothetical protein DHEL01_v204051 [Diaporthe helianthi]|uniref:Autophagy protein n=1 Tax=Diaporthe helianthi TaxID=158607 RepID=A0A2P5I4Z7_DIAHE|nr:hypothetical protein DHEL01_v204051 [Diaporthe helianthi]